MEAMVYSSMSSAKRGAERKGVKNPVFEKTADGKVKVSEFVAAVAATAPAFTNGDGPVAVFKALFEANFGKVKRSELIAKAVEFGVSKNTAATYYQKLKTAKV